jgi:hypothetical protein
MCKNLKANQLNLSLNDAEATVEMSSVDLSQVEGISNDTKSPSQGNQFKGITVEGQPADLEQPQQHCVQSTSHSSADHNPSSTTADA